MDRGNQGDPELIAMDILSTEGPEVARGYHGRSQVGQVDAVTLAKAYLDAEASGCPDHLSCPKCGAPMDEPRRTFTGICPTHGVQHVAGATA